MKHTRGLKELVKSGEMTAREALTDLQDRADLDESWQYVKTTKTYRWLLKRAREEGKANDK